MPELEKIDFLHTQPREAYQYSMKKGDNGFGPRSTLGATGPIIDFGPVEQ